MCFVAPGQDHRSLCMSGQQRPWHPEMTTAPGVQSGVRRRAWTCVLILCARHVLRRTTERAWAGRHVRRCTMESIAGCACRVLRRATESRKGVLTMCQHALRPAHALRRTPVYMPGRRKAHTPTLSVVHLCHMPHT